MVDKLYIIKRIIKLYAHYAKMDLFWFLRDTKLVIMLLTADLLSNAASLTSIFMLAWKFNGIGNLNRYEVLFMLGYVSCVTGLFQLFFANCNTGIISRRIGRGQLEHAMIQPLALPVQLLTEGFIPISGSSNFITGIIIVIAALSKLNITLKWWWALAFLISIFGSLSVIIGLCYLFSSAAFYAPKQAEEIGTLVTDATGFLSTFPLSGMPISLVIPLISIFPAGVIGWLPSMVLIGRKPLDLPVYYTLIVALVISIIAFYAFRKGLNHYVKTGSNRYLSIGHRR